MFNFKGNTWNFGSIAPLLLTKKMLTDEIIQLIKIKRDNKHTNKFLGLLTEFKM